MILAGKVKNIVVRGEGHSRITLMKLAGKPIKRALLGAVTAGLGLMVPTAAMASSYDTLFPESIEIGGETLERTGVSKLKVGLIFNVYVAAFYQPAGKKPDEALDNHTKHLELYYLRNIGREDFIKAANDMLVRQHGETILETMRPGLEAINTLYRDVKKSDRYALT